MSRASAQSANRYEARRAVITDGVALRALGILMGSSANETLIMRTADWDRATACGAVRLLPSSPAVDSHNPT